MPLQRPIHGQYCALHIPRLTPRTRVNTVHLIPNGSHLSVIIALQDQVRTGRRPGCPAPCPVTPHSHSQQTNIAAPGTPLASRARADRSRVGQRPHHVTRGTWPTGRYAGHVGQGNECDWTAEELTGRSQRPYIIKR